MHGNALLNHVLKKDIAHYAFLVLLEMEFVGCFLCSSSVWAIGISNLLEEKKKDSFKFTSESDICFISGNFCLLCFPHSR